MAFNGTEGENVSLQEAAGWTAAYRATINEGDTQSQFYGRERIENILNQSGCMGIRMYHGIENGQKVIILVGVDAEGNDMTSGIIVEKGIGCPPICGDKNPLNS